jgi:hypothetical protein
MKFVQTGIWTKYSAELKNATANLANANTRVKTAIVRTTTRPTARPGTKRLTFSLDVAL